MVTMMGKVLYSKQLPGNTDAIPPDAMGSDAMGSDAMGSLVSPGFVLPKVPKR